LIKTSTSISMNLSGIITGPGITVKFYSALLYSLPITLSLQS
jgi:hypothetical protein